MRPRDLLDRAGRMKAEREAVQAVDGWEARKAEIIEAMDASRPELEAIVGKRDLDLMSRAEIARVIARLPVGALRDVHLADLCASLTAAIDGGAGR